MKSRFLLCLLFAAAFLLAALPAGADTFDFTLVSNATGNTYHWQIDVNATPDFHDWYSFGFDSVAATYRGSKTTLYDLEFDSFGYLVSHNSYNGVVLNLSGPVLYTGSLRDPIFKTGTFSLTTTGGSSGWTLTIVDPPSPDNGTSNLPEPASFLLLGVGILGLFTMRRTGLLPRE